MHILHDARSTKYKMTHSRYLKSDRGTQLVNYALSQEQLKCGEVKNVSSFCLPCKVLRCLGLFMANFIFCVRRV